MIVHDLSPQRGHTTGDELLHILVGGCQLTVREDGGEISRMLRSGDLAIPEGAGTTLTLPPA